MKFTQEEAIKALEGKVPAKDKALDLGRTIKDTVAHGFEIVGENSEIEIDAFVDLMWKQVATAIGFANNERSNAVTSLQAQINELKAKANQNPKNEDKHDEEDPAVKALREKLEKMENEMNQAKKQKTIAEKRQQLIDKMSESIKDKDWTNAFIAEVSITEETDVEAKAKDYVEFYNKTHTQGGKTTPKTTGGQDDESGVSAAIKAAAAIKKQRNAHMGGSPVSTTTVNN